MNAVLEQVLADLTAEGDALEEAVLPLDEQGWRTPVPAEGWDIAIAPLAHASGLAAGAIASAIAEGAARWRPLTIGRDD